MDGVSKWHYVNILRAHGAALGKFSDVTAAAKPVGELMDSAWRLRSAAAGNQLYLAMLRFEKDREVRKTKKLKRDRKREKECEEERRIKEEGLHRNAKNNENDLDESENITANNSVDDEDEDDDTVDFDDNDEDLYDANSGTQGNTMGILCKAQMQQLLALVMI